MSYIRSILNSLWQKYIDYRCRSWKNELDRCRRLWAGYYEAEARSRALPWNADNVDRFQAELYTNKDGIQDGLFVSHRINKLEEKLRCHGRPV